MRRTLLLLVGLAGCSATPPVEWRAKANWNRMSLAERGTALDGISDACKLARSTFALTTDDELRFQSDPTAEYKSVECALKKLAEVRGLERLGFIGNEVYEENKK